MTRITLSTSSPSSRGPATRPNARRAISTAAPALLQAVAEERALLVAEHELLVTQPETEADCDGLFGALSELFALVMASLVAQPPSRTSAPPSTPSGRR